MILFTALVFAALLPGAIVCVVLMGHAPPRAATRSHRPPRQSPRPVAAPDRLAETVRLWMADDRPAWETIDAFERDVARVLAGDQTPPGMPLRMTSVRGNAWQGYTYTAPGPDGEKYEVRTFGGDNDRHLSAPAEF